MATHMAYVESRAVPLACNMPGEECVSTSIVIICFAIAIMNGVIGHMQCDRFGRVLLVARCVETWRLYYCGLFSVGPPELQALLAGYLSVTITPC